MKKGIFRFINFALIAFVFSIFSLGCDDGSNKNELEGDETKSAESPLSEVDSKRAVLVESIIRSSPTLAQTGEIFGELGTDFTREYLNDINNVNSYTTLAAKGINLGVYLADLGYITTYEQSQEVIFYMNCAQKLAEGIGVSDVFDESTVERMELNINDKDSIIELISELYWKTDAFLKELNRENISALIICGGWVEGLHVGSKLIADGFDDDVIYDKIFDQKKNLKKILTLLSTFEGDENIDMFEAKFQDIDAEFANIPAKGDASFTQEQKDSLKSISEKIEAIRNEIVQP